MYSCMSALALIPGRTSCVIFHINGKMNGILHTFQCSFNDQSSSPPPPNGYKFAYSQNMKIMLILIYKKPLK